MTLSIVLSAALPLLTGAMALMWAGWVAPERETSSDLSGPATRAPSEGGRGR